MRWLARCGPVYNQPFWRGQAIAFVTVLVAVAIRASVSPFINGGLNFTFLFPGILVAGPLFDRPFKIRIRYRRPRYFSRTVLLHSDALTI